ncbi:MAG: hypothetical protein JW910_06045 [Anaerolineae bacterium]|nr:hypothetical protein [Anaerolineae bacterium]
MFSQPPPSRPTPRLVRGRGVLFAVLIALCLCCAVSVAGLALLLVQDQAGPPTDEAALVVSLRQSVAEAQAAWSALDDLWGRLEGGASARCSEESLPVLYFVVWRSVDLAAYPALAAQVNAVNAAITDVHRAADAWTQTCQGGAVEISSGVAVAARAALDRAATRLAEVTAALDALPGQ